MSDARTLLERLRINSAGGGTLSLRENFSWTFGGNVIYAACQWGMLVAITKFTDGRQLGQFALALAITAPVVLLTNLNLRTAQATDVHGHYAFGDYLGLRLLSTLAALLIIAGSILAAGYDRDTAAVILGVGLAKAIEAFSDLFFGLSQQRERMDQVGRSLILKGSLSLIALAGVTWATHHVLWGIGALIVAWGVVFLTYDLRNGRRLLSVAWPPVNPAAGGTDIRPRWVWATMGRLLTLSIPLGLSASLVSLMANVPNYFLEHFSGGADVGVFSALDYLIVAGLTVMLAMGQAATPRLARTFAERDMGAYRALLLRLIGLAALIGGLAVGVAVVAGKTVLAIVYVPEFAQYQPLLVLLAVSGGISYIASALSYGLAATRAFDRYAVPYALVALAAVLACWVLIPEYGLTGAAWASIIADIGLCLVPISILIPLWRKARLESGAAAR